MNNPPRFYSSTLFPDLSTSADQSTNYRGKKRRQHHNDDEISAFGYESKIYNDQNAATKVDNGSYLIPWKSKTDARVFMDRFDVRHLVEDQVLFRVDQKAILDKEYDVDRYADLDTDETDGSRKKAAIHFNYDVDDGTKEKDSAVVTTEFEKGVMAQYKTPSSMHVPKNQEQLLVIQATAKEIGLAATNSSLLEIRIQVKNASNALYSFLNKQDVLYPFYKHVLSYRCTSEALVAYSDSEDDEDEDDIKDSPPDELKQVILKTAEFIAKSNKSDELEHHIKLKRGHDPKFRFLNAGDVYYNYFKSLLRDRKR